MTTYLDEKRHLIEQFAHYLRLMGLRRHKIVKEDDCFIIFDQSAPKGVDAAYLKDSAAVRVDCLANGGFLPGGDDAGETPSEDLSPEESFRYIQFAFMRDCFYPLRTHPRSLRGPARSPGSSVFP